VAPKTGYAKASGGVHIAFQVVGDGPADLLLVPGWVSHLDFAWEEPSFARFLGRIASFARLILIDRRGTGLSDRVTDLPTLEQRMDDVRVVMDAAGSERASVFGISEGGPMCSLFAATYPERTSALVLYGTFATGFGDADYPSLRTRANMEELLATIASQWGTGTVSGWLSPSVAGDPRLGEAWARFERLAVSPGGAVDMVRMGMDADVRSVLPVIRVPTLVLQRAGDQITPVAEGRYLADHIPGARYVELEGDEHFPWLGNSDALLDAVQEFLTGVTGAVEPDRVLATVLFTDIVGATEKASALGDRKWRECLDLHDAHVRRELERHRGQEIKTTGDGFLAAFDGPARAIRCAAAIRDATRLLGLEVRAGLHTGECERRGGDLFGLSVHIGARVAALAGPGEVLVSGTVKDLVAGSGLRFEDRGTRVLKGVPGEWRLFAVAA
jgi:class 3 adenylate cyclase/alpha-beta hydrolase superfamily lysophospholipase